MSQLHELLAVEGDLKGEKIKIGMEAKSTFSKKPGLFHGFVKKLEMFDENRSKEETTDTQVITTTVKDKLNYISGAFERYFDVKLQKESANQEAKADVILSDGTKIIEGAPVTFLLGMEEELKQLRDIYGSIPTLQSGIKWEKDAETGDCVWRDVNPPEKMKTEKTIRHKVLTVATKEHPAQIEKWHEDVPVGKYIVGASSGMISSAQKSVILSRLDMLIRAFKKARQRANNQKVKNLQIGELLFNYINGEL